MKRKNILLIILVVVIIIFLLTIIHTFRNYFIIKELQEKIETYSLNRNYHIEAIGKYTDNSVGKVDTYQKDNKQVMIIEKTVDGETSKLYLYSDNENYRHTFFESKDKRIANFDDGKIQIFYPKIVNGLESENDGLLFFECLTTIIRKENYNGKTCYIIENFSPDGVEYNNIRYYEKDTGLTIKNIDEEGIIEYKYEFDNVTDSTFEEPDISLYEIVDKL